METYTNTDLPPFWWLRPWHHARRLHAATYALLDQIDELDEANYEIARLNDELSLANAKVDELTAALQRHAKPANVEKLKSDLAYATQSVKNLRKRWKDAEVLLRKEQATSERLRDELREQVGLVNKAGAVIKFHGLDKPGKLLFEDKVGGNSIHAPKPKAKKKGGAK